MPFIGESVPVTARAREGERGTTAQQVQERAYAIWEGEGRPHGHDLVHWFQAEVPISSAFPEDDFRTFAIAASTHFPAPFSDADLSDRTARWQFDRSCQAVRFLTVYRLCTECCGEYKALRARPSELWAIGWADEELNYKLERCIYVFCMSGLSVLENFVFCLYFYGNAIHPDLFAYFNEPRKINIATTSEAFAATFPAATITQQLVRLRKEPAYIDLDTLRNILAHRLAGRRSVKILGTTHADGSRTELREENWHVPGLGRSLSFDDDLLQRHLVDIRALLTTLISVSRQFAEGNPS
jgi:hypothetical protein